MTTPPIYEETPGLSAGPMISALSGISNRNLKGRPLQLERMGDGTAPRKLAIYNASTGFEMLEELEYLTYRTIEPNIFFNPNFLIPAIPRLEDKTVRLIVMRDEVDDKSRLRLLLPYSIERPAFGTTPPVIRSWANVFGPNGTPLIDGDDPIGVMRDFFSIMGREHLRLPPVIMFPQIYTDGAAARIIRSVALENDLPLQTTNRQMRAMLESNQDGESYLRHSISKEHYREITRQGRRFEEMGDFQYNVASRPDDIRIATEAFLSLEAKGWKGKARTAMLSDRLQAAFAREATHNLAKKGLCRIHTLQLDGKLIASLIVFIENGVASTWKITFDEDYSRYSPGKLLMSRVTEYLLNDFNVLHGDSCAVPDHPLMNHLWSERKEMATLIVGLHRNTDRQVRQVAGQLDLYDQTRSVAKTMRDRLRSAIKNRPRSGFFN